MISKKILNLYAGIGGNAKLWDEMAKELGIKLEVTAIEFDEATASEYKKNFPNHNVIVTDAHEYLLNHYKEFDFIWASPPCPTHSTLNHSYKGTEREIKYPDMKLYQEIILLKHFCTGKYCIENVVSYYDPLIKPQELGRHYFWANFNITNKTFDKEIIIKNVIGSNTVFGFNVKSSDIKDKRKALRNCVDPKLGAHILKCAFKKTQKTLFE